MADSSSDREPLDELVESFLARFRAGERPSLTEYATAHPELADQIRDLFPALVEMEQAGSVGASATSTASAVALFGSESLDSLGDYRIIREVGRGGMGVVYEAVQESLGRHVALKVFAHRARSDPKLIERFHREARAAARLHHTNIVPVFGVGEHGAHRYYAMQFIQGQALDAIIHEIRRLRSVPESNAANPLSPDSTRSAPLAATVARSLLTGRFANREADDGSDGTLADACTASFKLADAAERSGPAAPSSDASHWASQPGGPYARTIARVGLQVAEALAHAHGQRILHRDIKPSNLLVDIEGNIWVTDFGLAKADDAEALTEPGDIVGTLRYMAPERFRGDSGPASDVYGLGVTLYELLTLRPAFDDGDRPRLIDHILHADPPTPRSVDEKIPRDLETIVLKAMAKHPADRYESARALAEDLDRFLQDRTILARRSSVAERLWRLCKRNRLLAALGALAATLTITIAIGSTVAAILLGQSRSEALENLGRARSADAGRTRQLWESFRTQARAGRFSHRVGQRFASLAALKRAAALGVFPDRKGELRDEAIACLALPDVRLERSLGVSYPEDFADYGWIAFDSTLEHFAYSDRNGAITLRQVDTGEVLGRLPGLDWRPTRVELAFSRDNQWLVIGRYGRPKGAGPTVAWQVDGKAAGRVLTLSEVDADFQRMGADGQSAILFWPDKSIAFVELASGRERRRLKLDLEHTTSLSCVGRPSPDGRLFAFADRGRPAVHLLDLQNGARVHRFELAGDFSFLAWSPDGQLLAVACDDRQIYIFETASKRLISVLQGHSNADIHVAFSHAGDFVISWSWDGTTRIWNPIQGSERLNIAGSFVALSGDDHRVAIVKPVGQIEVHELAAGRECRALYPGRVGNRSPRPLWESAESVDFSADGRLLASAGDGVSLWEIASFTQIAQLPIGQSCTARFGPEGTSLLTFGIAGLRLWPLAESHSDEATTLRIGPPRLADLPLNSENSFASWDGAGRLIVATDVENQRAVLLDPTTLAERGLLLRHAGVRFSIPSPDGRWVATSAWHGSNVKVWDTADGALAWQLTCGSSIAGFSPDGRWLVTALDHEYRLWRVGPWLPGVTIRSENSVACSFAFTPDGGILAVNRGDRAHLVDPENGREVAMLEPPPELPHKTNTIAFSANGGLLAIATDHAVLVWDLRLIRAQLAAMALDWDAPPIPATQTAPGRAQVRIRVEGADALAESTAGRAELSEGHFDAAAAAYARAIRKGADEPVIWYRHMLFRLRAGDHAGYRSGCAELMSRFGHDDRPGIAERVAWACTVGPDAVAVWSSLIGALEAAVKQRPENPRFQKTLGAVLVRAGRAREAIAALEESVRKNGHGGNAFDWLFLALAHHRLGRAESARAALAKARDWIAHGDERALPDPYLRSPLPWLTQLELELLLHETEGQISQAADLPAEVFAPR
jgi:serine/threonine protein kinase/WD40 repeat protein